MTYKNDTSIKDMKKKLQKMDIETDFLDASPKDLKKIKNALLKESPEGKKENIVREFKIQVIDKILSEAEQKPQITVQTDKGLNSGKQKEGVYDGKKPVNPKDTKSKLQAAEYRVVELKKNLEKVKQKYEKSPSEKANELIQKIKDQINEAEEFLYESKNELVIKAQLNEDAQSAESIMAAIAIQEEISEIQKEVGKIQNDTVDKFIEQIRAAYDSDKALEIRDIVSPAIEELMDKIRDTKDQMFSVVSLLTGESGDEDMLSNDDLNDMADEEGEENSEESSESDLEKDTESDDVDLDIDVDIDAEESDQEKSDTWEKK